jgi:hypothetical protein
MHRLSSCSHPSCLCKYSKGSMKPYVFAWLICTTHTKPQHTKYSFHADQMTLENGPLYKELLHLRWVFYHSLASFPSDFVRFWSIDQFFEQNNLVISNCFNVLRHAVPSFFPNDPRRGSFCHGFPVSQGFRAYTMDKLRRKCASGFLCIIPYLSYLNHSSQS